MPKDNTVLIRVFPASENGECYVQQLDVDGDILAELWAIPVPPHGRLIDADALKASLVFAEETAKWAVPALRAVLMVIDEMPTIVETEEGETRTKKDGFALNVAERKKGKWIMNDECRTVCSLCGNVVAFISHQDRRWDFGNYCPNCGAKMESEGK